MSYATLRGATWRLPVGTRTGIGSIPTRPYSPAMSFTAVLDASVLYPLPLRDTLLRVAEAELYDPCWSEQILDEVARNLTADHRVTEAQADDCSMRCAAPSMPPACPTRRSLAWSQP